MDERKFRTLFAFIVALQLIGTALVVLQQHRHQQQLQDQLAFFTAALTDAPTVNTASSAAAPQLSQAAQRPLQQLLREIVRAELQQRSTHGASTDMSTKPSAPTMTDAARREQERQYANSEAVLGNALASGRWTVRDTEALIPYLGQLSNRQRVQLLERFHAAVNRQELELEDIPPL